MTGVFCQSAIESAQNDHLTVAQSLIDNRVAHVQRLRTLFEEIGFSVALEMMGARWSARPSPHSQPVRKHMRNPTSGPAHTQHMAFWVKILGCVWRLTLPYSIAFPSNVH